MRQEQEKALENGIQSGSLDKDNLPELEMPIIPYVRVHSFLILMLHAQRSPQFKCRQIMTRADFLEGWTLASTVR